MTGNTHLLAFQWYFLFMMSLLAGFFTGILRAASPDEHINQLREEIHVIEKRINEAEAGKRGVIQQLQDLNHQIDLRRRLIKELETQVGVSSQRVSKLESKIGGLEAQIAELTVSLNVEEAELSELRQQVGARISQLYKRRNTQRVALLLGSKNLNDFFERQQYVQAIERYDRASIERLQEKRDAVRNDRDKRKNVHSSLTIEKARRLSEMERIRGLLNQRRVEEGQLARRREEKNLLLEQISGDTELLRALLSERRRALEEIEREIDRLERRAPEIKLKFKPDTPFDRMAGKLPWPLKKHTISKPFGRIRHPELGTTTINPGIDLAAVPGDPVYAVAYGQVTRIAYLRGFGNTVILSHGEGYYTVYARLGTIFVTESEITGPGQPIGEVGEIEKGGGFHFEIWSNRNKQDPIKWLSR